MSDEPQKSYAHMDARERSRFRTQSHLRSMNRRDEIEAEQRWCKDCKLWRDNPLHEGIHARGEDSAEEKGSPGPERDPG